MKKATKILSSVFALLLVIVMQIPAFAEYYIPEVDGKGKCMIHNEYYSFYSEELFKNSYESYLKMSDETKTDKMNGYFESIKDDNEHYATVIFDDAAENNTENAKRLFAEEDILYVGSDVSAVTVRICSEDTEEIKNSGKVAYVGPAFFNYSEEPVLLPCVTGGFYMGNVIGPESAISGLYYMPSANDARMIMRFAAGLESKRQNKKFYYTADMDLDGKITVADARLALRAAVRIDKPVKIEFGYSVYWDDSIVI